MKRLVVLIAIGFLAGVSSAQEPAASDASQPEISVERTTVFNSREFNPYYFHIKNWPHKINIGLYAQFRQEYTWANTEPGQGDEQISEFRLNRARFFMEGKFLNRLHYKVALNRSGGDDFSLQQAYLKFNLSKGWKLWVGQEFFNTLREDWPDPTQTASMDNSAMDYTFGAGTALGAMVQNTPTRKARWWFSVNDGAAGARSYAADVGNSSIAFIGRLDYQIVGTDWTVWDDLIGGRGLPFGVMVGFFGGQIMGIANQNTAVDEDLTQIGGDLNLNGDGYQIVLAGVLTKRSAPDISSYHHYGAYFQAGYFFRPKWQAYIRYDYVSPGNQGGGLESYLAPGLGVNFFPIVNRRWRVTAELNYLHSAINNTIVQPVPELGWAPSDVRGQTSFRMQVQVGF
jgi:hypothetical protein